MSAPSKEPQEQRRWKQERLYSGSLLMFMPIQLKTYKTSWIKIDALLAHLTGQLRMNSVQSPFFNQLLTICFH